MTKKFGLGRSHSKIILMGEHAVVYGYPALAIPLHQLEVSCRITRSDLEFFPSQDYLNSVVAAAVEAASNYLAKDPGEWLQLCPHIQSTIPEQCGMGSSAAVAIAAVRSVFDYYQEELPNQVLEELVNQAEKVAHGNPSGLDAKTCLSDQPIVFRKQTGFLSLPVNLGAYLVIADTGLKGQTSLAVAKVAELGQPGQVHLEQLGFLAEAFIAELDAPQIAKLGEKMTQAHALLKELGVSCSEADHLVSSAISVGAQGAKMSGGGLGGCIIALCQNREEAERVALKIK